jgi:5-methylcytosine-specific restriction endonuclease McrA
MAPNSFGPRRPGRGSLNQNSLDQIVARAHHERDQRMQGYREQALKLYPWVCTRCGRSFSRENLTELTVHHKDHDHDNNPADGSNWELLCLYCHENEHARHRDFLEAQGIGLGGEKQTPPATHQPFAGLKERLKQKKGG